MGPRPGRGPARRSKLRPCSSIFPEKMSQEAEAAYSIEENEENQRTTKTQSCFTMHSTITIHSCRFWQGIGIVARGILLVKLVKGHAVCRWVYSSIFVY